MTPTPKQKARSARVARRIRATLRSYASAMNRVDAAMGALNGMDPAAFDTLRPLSSEWSRWLLRSAERSYETLAALRSILTRAAK